MASSEDRSGGTEKKLLKELRVVDLRAELEERDLDRSGVKADLIQRLEMALLTENLDPGDYRFDVPEGRTASKRSKSGGKSEGGESEATDGEEAEEEQMEISDSMMAAEGGADDIQFSMDFRVEEDTDDSMLASKEPVEVATDNVPPPEQVEPRCPFTVEDTIQLHAAAHEDTTSALVASSDSISMIVHPEDETAVEREADGSGGPTGSSESNEDREEKRNEAKNEQKVTSSPPEEPSSTVLELEGKSVENTEENGDGGKNEDQKPTTTEESDKKESASETQETTEKEDSGAKSAKTASTSDKSLWISNLSQTTRATDLKALFSKYGRVTAAKIVTSKGQGSSGSKYYGMVAMSTADEAAKCVTNLHRVELKGKMIEIERKQQPERLAQKPGGSASGSGDTKSPTKSDDKKTEGDKKDGDDKRKEAKSARKETGHSRHRSNSHKERDRKESRRTDERRRIGGTATRRPVIVRQRPRPPPLMNRRIAPPRRPLPQARPVRPAPVPPRPSQFELMELERKRTEFERAELLEKMKQKEMEHLNREEQLRLQRERERLKFEREKLEREKLELQQLKMTQQAVSSFGTYQQSPTAANAVPAARRSFEQDVPTPGYQNQFSGHGRRSSRERSRDHTGRRERSDYHHSSAGDRNGGRSQYRSPREGDSGRHSTHQAPGYGRQVESSRNEASISYGHRSRNGVAGMREKRRTPSPRRSGREVTITTPGFTGSNWEGAPGTQSRHSGGRGDFTSSRNAAAGPTSLPASYNGRMGSWATTGQEPQIATAVAPGTWARPQGAGVQTIAGVLPAEVVYGQAGAAGYSSADRFDAYKYSSSRPRY